MDEYNTDVFRQTIKVGEKKYGKVGFLRILHKDYLQISSFEDGNTSVEFPLKAVPQLITLLLHAYATKNRQGEDETYVFPRLEENV